MSLEESKKRTREDSVESTEQLSSNDILAIVQEIKDHSGNAKDKLRYFRKKMPEFADKYPSLFQMACEPDFDIQRLSFMLNMRDNVSNQPISQHQASVRVGENLFKQYVKPLVDKQEADKKNNA